MIAQILKDNGQFVQFDANKIAFSIAKAGETTDELETYSVFLLTNEVLKNLENDKIKHRDYDFSTFIVRLRVEKVLEDSIFQKTARAYKLYARKKEYMREQARLDRKPPVDLIGTYLEKQNWRIRENSNTFFSLQGMNGYISADVTRKYWLDKIYPKEIRDAHISGDLHIHDLNQLSVYCVGWDLLDLLKEGFKGIAGNVESGPPKHLRTALGQLYNFFYTLQGEAAGAQAISNFDTLLAPFIRYDNLTEEEVYQAVQEFVFNLNIPTRVGFQTPFTNITLDLKAPSYFADTPVLIGGEFKQETYKEFQPEMDLFNKIFAEIMMKGDYKGRIFTFPIPTYSLTKDFDWTNPVLDSVWKMTGRYGIPYFANYVNSDMSPEDARSMCCRLRLDTRELRRRGGGLFGANPLTGSIGVVTLNLPRLGYEHAGSKTVFFNVLDKLVNLACESLRLKREVLEDLTEKDLYPYSKFYLRDVKAKTGKFWSNHFSTVGIVGSNEACKNFLGQDIAAPEGKKFALEILDFINGKLVAHQDKTGVLFNLEATPAEGTSYRLARLDLAVHNRYSDKTFEFANTDSHGAPYYTNSTEFANTGNHDAPYYTNSTHLPVDKLDDIFEVLDHQDELQCKYTGGTVLHGFIGEQIPHVETVRSLVKRIADNYKLPYFTLTPTFSICPNDGYLPGEQPVCPHCKQQTDVYSRIVGYFRPLNRWNDGKQAEYAMRKTFKVVTTKSELYLAGDADEVDKGEDAS
jgi:ribonucleoside-triphosphate reductase